MKLEDKIKALLEGNSSDAISERELQEKVTVKDKAGDEMTMGDDDQEDDASDDQEDQDTQGDDDQEDDASDDQGGEDTDVSKNTKKNVVDVKEEASNATLTAGKSRKDGEGVKAIRPPESGQKGDDKGLNAKLKAGFGRKDGEGVKASATSGQNDSNKTNDVDSQSLSTKPFKVTVGEHMEAMFQGQELSEEFVQKAGTIFEAAVSQIVEQRLSEEIESLQEEFQTKLEESVGEVQSALIEQVDGYLDQVVEQWVEDNAVALESGIKVEMVSGFIDGLKTLFKEHYIEVPEEKLDVIEEQAARISELEEALVTIDEAHNESEAEVVALKRHIVAEAIASDLTATQKEKFLGLVEGIEFDSDVEFETKLKTIKESYFPVGKTKQIAEAKTVKAAVNEDVAVNKYVDALYGPSKFAR